MEETKKFHERIAVEGVKLVIPQVQRTLALETLNANVFPTTRTEAWKYTRTTRISNASFTINPTNEITSIENYKIEGLSGSVLVFINGFYNEALSEILPEDGIQISPISQVSQEWITENATKKVVIEGEIFNAINTYFATDGVAISINKNVVAKQTIQVIHLTTGTNKIASTRNIIHGLENAQAHITFSYYGENSEQNFTNAISEIHLERNAKIFIDKIQAEGESDFQISTEQVTQEKDSTFTLTTSTFSGAIVRNNVNVHVVGENAETNLFGTYLLNGKQVVDNHTTVDHKVAHCISNELYKGVLDDASTGVFNGKVFVRQDAQKINAFQSNANVLLSDNASMNSKPELEIYADDVKCSHGSTTGQIDEEAIFYLRARGISEKSAKSLLLHGFIGDVLDKFTSEEVKEKVTTLVNNKLGVTKD
jgi:Fe-S cluster assembly protein SufD